MTFLLAASLRRGHSGVRVELVELLLGLLDGGVVPVVPSRGSVGSSGDLAPLAHLALVLIGEGEATVGGSGRCRAARRWAAPGSSRSSCRQGGARADQRDAPHGGGGRARPARGRSAWWRPRSWPSRCRSRRSRDRPSRSTRACTSCAPNPGRCAWRPACGRCSAGSAGGREPRRLRPCAGPLHAALRAAGHRRGRRRARLRRRRARARARGGDRQPARVRRGRRARSSSGGNFHGQPLSLALDHLALAMCELASFSERRTFALLSPSYAGLPAFLTPRPGLSHRADDRPVRGGGARQRVPGARPSGGRRVDPHLRRDGGLQLDGRARRAQGAPGGRATPPRSSPPSWCAPARGSSSTGRCARTERSRRRSSRARAGAARRGGPRAGRRAGGAGRRACAAARSGSQAAEVRDVSAAGASLPRLAAGGGAADAREQPRPGRGRAAGGPRGLRRHRQGGAQPRVLRRDRRELRRLGDARDAARAVRQAGRRCSRPTRRRRAC